MIGAGTQPLSEITEDEATGPIKATFEDLKRTLRIPYVDGSIRVIAANPDYLQLAWRQIEPNTKTVYFERAADRIRARAAEGVARVGPGPQLPPEAADVLRVFHYAAPKLFLAVRIMRSATTGQLPQLQTIPQAAKAQIVTGVPADAPGAIDLVKTDGVGEPVRAVFEDVRATLRVPFVPDLFRALAAWPDYLTWAWQALKTTSQQPAFRESLHRIRRTADEEILALPFRVDLNPHTLRLCGLSEGDIDMARERLDVLDNLSQILVLDVASLAGATGSDVPVAQSPFPASTA